MFADSVLNKKFDNAKLFEISITPEGNRDKIDVYIWAKDKLDVSNYLALNNIYGTIHDIKEA